MPADRCGNIGFICGTVPLVFQGELGAESGCEAVWEEVYVRQQRGNVLELGPGNQGSNPVTPLEVNDYIRGFFNRMQSSKCAAARL